MHETACFSGQSASPNVNDLPLRCDGCETVSCVVGSCSDRSRTMVGSVPHRKWVFFSCMCGRQNSIVICNYTVKVPLSQPCFDHFFGPCFRGHDEAGLLAFSMSLFSDVGPLEAIAENKTEQKSAAKRRQRLLKAPLKPPSYDACFPTARSV